MKNRDGAVAMAASHSSIAARQSQFRIGRSASASPRLSRTRQAGIVGQFERFLTVFDRRGHIATLMRELREIDQDDISPIN